MTAAGKMLGWACGRLSVAHFRPASSGTARTRPPDSVLAGQIQEKVRRGHQCRGRTARAREDRPGHVLPGRRADDRQEAGGRGRGGDRRVGQQPRGAGPVDPLLEGPRAVPSLRAGARLRHRAAAVRGQRRPSGGDLDLPGHDRGLRPGAHLSGSGRDASRRRSRPSDRARRRRRARPGRPPHRAGRPPRPNPRPSPRARGRRGCRSFARPGTSAGSNRRS